MYNKNLTDTVYLFKSYTNSLVVSESTKVKLKYVKP